MFYYHNPLSFPSGAPRLPSLELPFSSTQPCKNAMTMLLEYYVDACGLGCDDDIGWRCLENYPFMNTILYTAV